MTTHAIAYEIKSRTEIEFGQPINPHAFRHLAATTIATADPGGAADIQMMLGHATNQTAEKYYNHARMIDASRSYQTSLDIYRGQIPRFDQNG
jgi:integrase/recombinase XerD